MDVLDFLEFLGNLQRLKSLRNDFLKQKIVFSFFDSQLSFLINENNH